MSELTPMEEEIRLTLNGMLACLDELNEKRLPVGSRIRAGVETLDAFQNAYVSKTWNEKKRRKMDEATKHLRPVYTVVAHSEPGVMLISDGKKEYETDPGKWWEIVEEPIQK